jgi:hypothetical protein
MVLLALMLSPMVPMVRYHYVEFAFVLFDCSHINTPNI